MKSADSPAGDLFPLTRSQLLLWTGQRLAPAEPLYNMVLAFDIEGEVDVAAFRSAFSGLLRECDALRIVFEERDGVPRQRFLESVSYELPVVDLRSEKDPAVARQQWIAEQSQHLFPLDGLLFHSALLQLADDKFVWYLIQHHLITDAWSASVIFDAMAALYEQATGVNGSPVASMPRFQDYVSDGE